MYTHVMTEQIIFIFLNFDRICIICQITIAQAGKTGVIGTLAHKFLLWTYFTFQLSMEFQN